MQAFSLLLETTMALCFVGAFAITFVQARSKPWRRAILTGVACLLAIVGAVALGLLHLRIDSSLERAVVAAFVGAMLGSLVGWPISCMLR